jgi:hypothetical protein
MGDDQRTNGKPASAFSAVDLGFAATGISSGILNQIYFLDSERIDRLALSSIICASLQIRLTQQVNPPNSLHSWLILCWMQRMK